MAVRSSRKIPVFIAAIFLSLVLFWVGLRLLLVPNDSFTPTQLFITGVGFVFCGILVLTGGNIQGAFLIGGLLVVSGFYLFGRAAGTIDWAWLARIAGLGFWCGAGMILAVAWPRSEPGLFEEDRR